MNGFGCSAAMCAGIIGGAFFLWPAIQNAREAARRTQCNGDLFWIRAALRNYQDTYGSLPPAIVSDDEGRPLHSWRVLLMDHGGHLGEHRHPPLPSYRFDEPWNSANNRPLETTCFQTFACPSDPGSMPGYRTNLVAVVGDHTLWPPSGTRTLPDLAEAREQYADKILLIELPDSEIHWMEPQDMTFDEALALFSSPKGLKATRHHRDALWCKPEEGLHFITYGGRYKSFDSIRDAQQFAELLQIETASMEEERDRPGDPVGN